MTLSLANDQKFFQSVILYEVNNWTPIDKICENLRELVDNELFPKSCLFPEISVESLTELVKDMDVEDVDSIQNDQKFIRSVIFYENHIGKEKEDIYKKLCRNIEADSIDYPMFSHWYDRFKNRYFDIDDESIDSKSPTFSELPVDVIEVVVEKLELKEQLSLRKVSRSFRIIVDQQKPAYKTIEFYFEPNHVYAKFNDEHVVYCATEFDVMSHYHFGRPKNVKMMKSSDYCNTAFNDLAVALKNPKLQLESLEFEYRTFNKYPAERVSGYKNAPRIYEKMENLLKTLNHKISVKLVTMMTERENHMATILPYLKPRVLKTIRLIKTCFDTNTDVNIDEIVTLDQWKLTKCVTIDGWMSTSIENLFHLKDFRVQLKSISIGDLIRIRDKLLASNEFRYCHLVSDQLPSFNEIDRVFEIREQRTDFEGYILTFSYSPIPNSNKILQFAITPSSISIVNKSRLYRFSVF